MKKIKIKKRDRLLLKDIGDQGGSIADAIHKTRFPNNEIAAMKSTLRRLRKAKLIKSEKVRGSKYVVYRLTKDGAKEIGVKYSDKPIGSSNLPRLYGMLWLTRLCDDGVAREICKPKDHKDLFKFGGNRLPKVDFYLASYGKTEPATHVKLGVAIIDFKSRTERIVHRVIRHLRRFCQHGWFDNLIFHNAFEVTVLTGCEEKKRSIELGLANSLTKKLRSDFARLNPSSPLELPFTHQVKVAPKLFEFVPTVGVSKQKDKGEQQ